VAKPQIVELRDVCVFLSREDASTEQEQVLLRQRPHEAKVWWRGMWELPRTTARERRTQRRRRAALAVR
jgi:hypothetical protein